MIHGWVGSTNKAARGGIPETGTCADPEENAIGSQRAKIAELTAESKVVADSKEISWQEPVATLMVTVCAAVTTMY